MSEFLKQLAEWAAISVAFVGVVLIVILVLVSLGHAIMQIVKRVEGQVIFDETRHRAGRGILLGLEFLVAADIIHTVAVDLSFETIGVLAAIILIRTFLSFSLDVELTGRWPWQRPAVSPE